MIIILNHLYISFINKLWGYGGDLPVNPTLSKACLKTRSGGGDRRRRRRRGGPATGPRGVKRGVCIGMHKIA